MIMFKVDLLSTDSGSRYPDDKVGHILGPRFGRNAVTTHDMGCGASALAAPGMDSVYLQGLRDAKKLLDDGIFSKEEFEGEKAKLTAERDHDVRSHYQ